MRIVAMQDADGNVLLLSAAHARTYTQPAVQGEPERICFDADGMPIYSAMVAEAIMVINNGGEEIAEE